MYFKNSIIFADVKRWKPFPVRPHGKQYETDKKFISARPFSSRGNARNAPGASESPIRA
ncbi:hypothetical protein [uncultured Alistipes sp.]|uniref:hypothetical protein n=1 Tax=uncultured Alistipes sp. TaxID=538949 RepID=UPI00261D8E01|nr:hypothetical protein [uncultured Alistipes sp.]